MLGTNAYKVGFYQNFVWESDVYSNARRVTGDKLVLHAIGLCILVYYLRLYNILNTRIAMALVVFNGFFVFQNLEFTL